MVAAVGVLILFYWNTFTITKDFWLDDTYSHGWIIPFIALFIMWCQRKKPGGKDLPREEEVGTWIKIGIPLAVSIALHSAELGGLGWVAYAIGILVSVYVVFSHHEFEEFGAVDRWVGGAVLLVSACGRIVATYFDKLPYDRYTFLLSLLGVFMMVGGLPLIKRMWASALFFFFMMPLPSVVEQSFLSFLQRWAAIASTTVLQVLGVIAYRSGSQIHVDGLETPLFVAEACSGMRMVTIFSAMVLALVLVIDRPWWEKLILVISAVPIAFVTNVTRITATALLFLAVEGTSWQETFHNAIHDFNGYAMIFVAGGIMWFEYKVLTWLFVQETGDDLYSVSVPGGLPSARN